MPFNHILTGLGGRIFILRITTNQTATYDVEAKVIAQFGISGTIAGDQVSVRIESGISVVGGIGNLASLDGFDLHNQVFLNVHFEGSGGSVRGRGGRGGVGGDAGIIIGFATQYDPGVAGSTGRVAIRMGCPTSLTGTGDVVKGYAGGGGGGGGSEATTPTPTVEPGSGGGGGAALGAGGLAGSALFGTPVSNGVAGAAGTLTTEGAGGSNVNADGGDGGGDGGAAAGGDTGGNGGAVGGAAGSDGDAITTNGFDLTVGSNVTVTGVTA